MSIQEDIATLTRLADNTDPGADWCPTPTALVRRLLAELAARQEAPDLEKVHAERASFLVREAALEAANASLLKDLEHYKGTLKAIQDDLK